VKDAMVKEGKSGITPTGIAEHELVEVLVIKCEPSAPASVRRRLDLLFTQLSMPSMEAYEVKVAVGEAIGNAVRHGCKMDSGKFITVRIEQDADDLIFEISDDGPGFCLDEELCKDLDFTAGGGMGLALMHSLMDGVEFDFSEGTTVRLTKHLHSGTSS